MLLVVSVNVASGERSGYSADIDIGLSEFCDELSHLQVFGPFGRIDRNGNAVYEDISRPRQYDSGQSIAAKHYVMVPKLNAGNDYTEDSVTEQLKDLALYCSKNYVSNYTKRQSRTGRFYPVKQRTFGLAARDAVVVDEDGCLDNYISSDDCVRFLTQNFNFRRDFYTSQNELAASIMAPPYSEYAQRTLGYPAL